MRVASEICPLSGLGLFSKLLPPIHKLAIAMTELQGSDNSHLGLSQLVYKTELTFSHLDNFLNEASADFVFDFSNSIIYQPNSD